MEVRSRSAFKMEKNLYSTRRSITCAAVEKWFCHRCARAAQWVPIDLCNFCPSTRPDPRRPTLRAISDPSVGTKPRFGALHSLMHQRKRMQMCSPVVCRLSGRQAPKPFRVVIVLASRYERWVSCASLAELMKLARIFVWRSVSRNRIVTLSCSSSAHVVFLEMKRCYYILYVDAGIRSR